MARGGNLYTKANGGTIVLPIPVEITAQEAKVFASVEVTSGGDVAAHLANVVDFNAKPALKVLVRKINSDPAGWLKSRMVETLKHTIENAQKRLLELEEGQEAGDEEV